MMPFLSFFLKDLGAEDHGGVDAMRVFAIQARRQSSSVDAALGQSWRTRSAASR